MALTRPQLINTANAFISAYNKWTVADVLSIRSPSCIHRVLAGDRPVRNNAEFGEFLEGVIPAIRNFRLKIVDTSPFVVDVEARRVVLHLTSTGESDVGPYGNEYMFILTISEDGKKVDEIVEFLDTLYTAEFLTKLTEKTGQKLV
ncbi:hypothetical protein TARUN_1537 [Trichoderma arundinaceum]|uniref:SnoaL-like domain-containing protein n=1 Tax=Trichoderma arundinaceum TaxID=490622 RepID=A0A395NX06_TRIAR|nr:hypothetical protein TARUN_1537 [Trichoderma arundinaceum]